MWARRTAGRLVPARNPLRRTSDRIEAWLTVLIALVICTVLPGIGWWAASSTYRYDMRATAWERAHRFPVDAVLIGEAPGELDDGTGLPAPPPGTPARWTGPDGVVRTGPVFTAAKQRTGATVGIWVDANGTVVPPPARRNPVADAVLAAVLATGCIAGGLIGVRRVLVWWLDRRRMRAWQEAWLLVEPRWTRR